MHCSPIELRKAKRYRLSAPALFVWAPQDGNPQSGQGVTRDINTFGVYVLTDALPPVGALVQMEVLLPKLTDPGVGMPLAWRRRSPSRRAHDSRGTKTSEAGFAASVQFYPEATESALSHLKRFRASCVSPGL